MTVKQCKCCKEHYTMDCFKRYRNGRLYSIWLNCSNELEEQRRQRVGEDEAVATLYDFIRTEAPARGIDASPLMTILMEQMRLSANR